MTLIGTDFSVLPIKNMYKLLSYSKPDLIVMPIAPDTVLKHFKPFIKNPKTEKFSNRLYINQLIRRGYEIMPD
jgi:hypothetical protein